MEIDYRKLLKTIELRREIIEESSLNDDKLNVEFVNLGTILRSVRMIIKGELDTKVDKTFDCLKDKLPKPSEQNPPQREV